MGRQDLTSPPRGKVSDPVTVVNSLDRRGGAHFDIGPASILDPGCSTIDRAGEDHRVPDEADNPDLSASFSKGTGGNEFYNNGEEESKMTRGLNLAPTDLEKLQRLTD